MSTILLLLPLEKGRKHRHLAIAKHYGGGWWQVECMGEGKRCRAGTCKHTANMRMGSADGRRIKQVPRVESKGEQLAP